MKNIQIMNEIKREQEECKRGWRWEIRKMGAVHFAVFENDDNDNGD